MWRAGAMKIIIEDRYPTTSIGTFYVECLPPPDEHGDFWMASTPMTIRPKLPKATRAPGLVRDGFEIDQ
jgi:hypothetical protein